MAPASDPAFYVRVAIPTPLRQPFDYHPGDIQASHFKVGIRVRVPFGRRTVTGIVIDCVNETTLPQSKIKPVLQLLDSVPLLPESLLSLLTWAADYYHHSRGEVFMTALPALLRQGGNPESTEKVALLSARADNEKHPIKGPRQREILDWMTEQSSDIPEETFRVQGFSPSASKRLEEKGLLTWQVRDKKIVDWCGGDRLAEPLSQSSSFRLNQDQEKAIAELEKKGTHLLHGVTGSGKTEVYLEVIERVLKKGKQIIVLVPEIGLTPQTIDRFTRRFRVPIESMHSGLNDRERLSAWNNIRTNSSAILIGTRSAIFTPMKFPGLIVIDEEHDVSFKQNDGFRYSARDLAVMRGQIESLPVILGSATPSLESYHNALSHKYHISNLPNRAGEATIPPFNVIDTSNREVVNGFSRPLLDSIQEQLEKGNQILVFINRRGYAPVLFCNQCRWAARCRHCDANTTYHASSRKLVCHHCGTHVPVPASCPECTNSELMPLGTGTERSESGLRSLFPDHEILRIDRDTTRGKKSMQNFLDKINRGNAAILIGTQLLAKGHHFPKVTLAAILDIDSAFYSADYKALERMGQMVTQVAGRSGREEAKGQVVLQTRFPENPYLKLLLNKGYGSFARRLLEEREAYQLPPYSYQALLRADARDMGMAFAFLQEVKESEPKDMFRVTLSGPMPAIMEKRANRYRAQLMIGSSTRKQLHAYLQLCIKRCEQSKLGKKLRWSLDIDPMDLS